MAKSKKRETKLRQPDPKPVAKAPAPNPLPLPKVEAPKPKPFNKVAEYHIAPGHSFTLSGGGAPGKQIYPETFPGGLKNIKRHVDKGRIIES